MSHKISEQVTTPHGVGVVTWVEPDAINVLLYGSASERQKTVTLPPDKVKRYPRRDPFAPMFGKAITPWSRAFAWLPTETVDRGWVWLRLIWRRRIAKNEYLPGGADLWFQYAVSTTGSDQ